MEPPEIKIGLPYDLAVLLPGICISRGNEINMSKRRLHANICHSTIHNKQEFEFIKCPLTDAWIKRMVHIHDGHSAMKNEIF